MALLRRFLFSMLPLLLLASGCGQKGPLYLEGHEPRGVPKAATAKSKPKPPAQSATPAQNQPANKNQAQP